MPYEPTRSTRHIDLPDYPVREARARRARRQLIRMRVGAMVVGFALLIPVARALASDPAPARTAADFIDDTSAPTDPVVVDDSATADSSSDPSVADDPTSAASTQSVSSAASSTVRTTRSSRPASTATTSKAKTSATRRATVAPKPATTVGNAIGHATVVTPKPTTTIRPTTTAKPKPVTTPKPTTKPATTTAAPATTVPPSVYTADQIVALIRSMWPADSVDKALAIAWRESNYKPNVHNFCCYGLFQINASAHGNLLRAHGWATGDLYDPTKNVTVALELFESAGWGPWGG